LPEGAFGAGSQATVRWIPAVGNATAILLPSGSAHSSLVLRWHGSAIWRNSVRIFVNEQFVGEVAIEPGWRVYEVSLPASVLGDAQAIEVRFEFAEAHVPGEKEPQKFRGEQRVCNLALDWVQICTPDVPVGERKGVKWQPRVSASFVGAMQRADHARQFRALLQRRRMSLPEGEILSTYPDGVPRDLLVAVNSPLVPRPSSLLLVNGVFTDDPRWWATVLERVAKVKCGKFVRSAMGELPDRPDLMSAVLTAGTTKFLLVENRTGQPQKLRLSVPEILPSVEAQSENFAGGKSGHQPAHVSRTPVSEIVALSRDGERFIPLRHNSSPTFTDTVRYYAAYQVVFAPVKLSMPKWVAFPGQQTRLPIVVRNLTDESLTVSLQIDAFIASVKGEPVTVRLSPREQRQVALPVEIKPFADWGTKTVVVKGTWDVGKGTQATAYWLRPLIVGRNADVRCLSITLTSHTPTVTLVNAPATPFGDLNWWHPAVDVPGEKAEGVEIVLRFPANPEFAERSLPSEIRVSVGDLRDGEVKQVRLPLPFTSSLIRCSASLSIRWRDGAGTHEQTLPVSVTLMPEKLPQTHPDQIATIVVPDAERAQGLPMSVDLPASVEGENFVVRLPDGTPLPTHTEKVKGSSGAGLSWKVHFIVPPAKPSWRVDIGSEGDERVLVRGFSQREVWANGLTVRWLPGEGAETVLRIPRPESEATAYRLLLHGQAFWDNRVSVFAEEQKLAELDVKVGSQTLTVVLPASLWEGKEVAEVRLVFAQANVPAERILGNTDKRVCNFALDRMALEPAFDGQPLLLALCRADKAQSPSISVQKGNGTLQVDNGALELEWREDAGGTLTKLRSKATGRDYAAQSLGAGIGVFGRFDPQNPATTTDRFVVDDFVWQRSFKARVRVVERNPVWVTVEVTADGTRGKGQGMGGKRQGFRAVQRYRVFAGLPLIELAVSVEPRPSSQAPRSEELVALEARFNARWWTKSFPNFVGLGDKPPEVYGHHIVHFGWRMGNWLPPVSCLFNPNDLTETLSLLVVGNDGANLVRQGFWGERRGKPATERRYATVEIAAAPPRPVRLRLWLWLHEGHHKQAKHQRQKLLLPPSCVIVPIAK